MSSHRPGQPNFKPNPNCVDGITLTNNDVQGSGGIIKIPNGLNTSRHIDVGFTFIPTENASVGGDTIELEIDTVEVKNGDILDGTLPETHYSKIIPIEETDAGVVKRVKFEIDLPNVVGDEFFAILYYRDATAGNDIDDTYAGSIKIVSVDMSAYFWNE